MSWVKLDDKFTEHPKVIAAGPKASWLFVCGLTYCARNETDGEILADVVPRLTSLRAPAALALRLVEVGLWEVTPDGFQVHDYLDYQESSEKVQERRRKTAARLAKWRARNGGRNSVTEAQT